MYHKPPACHCSFVTLCFLLDVSAVVDEFRPVFLMTPPAFPQTLLLSRGVPGMLSVLSFSLDSRWGLHADRLALGKGLTYARSVPGLSLLQAADRTLTSCHLTSDLLVADLAITQGRHYWACSVEPGSYLVKVCGMV